MDDHGEVLFSGSDGFSIGDAGPGPLATLAECPLLGIGELAAEFGITPRTLRFYEAKGLLAPQRQGAARLYGRRDRTQLELILRAKRLGFTLNEIRRMLPIQAAAPEGGSLAISRRQCFDQIKLLEERKREIEAALAELRRTYSSFYARIVAGHGHQIP